MSRSWDKGSTRGWRRIRARVLLRDRGMCQLRIPGVCTIKATHVHHTMGRMATGDDERYLVAACEACNLKTGDPTRGNPQPRRVSRW